MLPRACGTWTVFVAASCVSFYFAITCPWLDNHDKGKLRIDMLMVQSALCIYMCSTYKSLCGSDSFYYYFMGYLQLSYMTSSARFLLLTSKLIVHDHFLSLTYMYSV